MTTGYLWTGQFEELIKVIRDGQPQSMELDSETLEGHWATDNNLGVDFFIINDATFSKLCILGDDVEPCFEGASVTSPEVSKNFAQGTEFQQTLFTMMNDLQTALNSKGGLNMSDENVNLSEEVVETAEIPTEEFALEEEQVVEEVAPAEPAAEFEDNTETTEEVVEEAANEESEPEEFTQEEVDNKAETLEEETTQFTRTEEEYAALVNENESLRAEIEELRQFKLNIETERKDKLIASYHMLSDEDKADVIAHKSEYTFDEIKAKLAVIYVEKNVNFDMIDGQEEAEVEELPPMTFSLDEEASESVPAFLEALRQTNKN